MYELPPANFPSPRPTGRVSATPRIGVLVAIWLALVACYGAYRWLYQPPRSEAKVNTVPPRIVIPPDWSHHVGSLSNDALDAEASLRHVEEEIRRTLALTDSSVEARHLRAALASLDVAHQNIVRSHHDIEALELLLKGANQQ
jgi:hypothetical protein